jgi:ABC-type transporter Mla subunit MlaD
MVLGLAFVSATAVTLPLIVRLARLFLLERQLRQLQGYAEPDAAGPFRDELRSALVDSPIHSTWQEFERRWSTAQVSEGLDRAPIRLADCFDEQPLLPFGPRRALLPILPGLFLGAGVFAALTGIIPSLADSTIGELAPNARASLMTTQLGLALRATAWGFLCAMVASVSGRLIEGLFDARSRSLDEIVESAFGSVSPGELAELTRQTQQSSLDTLGRELTQFANELNERLDRGLQRIEQSTARSANLVSQEQRGALHTVVQELSLSVRQGVEHHLSELRGALQRAVDHQTSVTGGLAETFERMVENSETQDRVARTLSDSANSVQEAARAMRGSTTEMQPVLENLSSTSQALSATAEHMGETQSIVARTAEGVRGALEHAASGVDDQRQFIELSLTEIRRSLQGLGDGLGESLQRSLREVDGVLGSTIGQLRDTLAESNETIDRLSGPIRAAEGTTRETHLALDRVRAEVEALGQWMNQAARPLRSGLVDIEGRSEEIARAINEFTNHTRHIDKTMETLREQIHEESRLLQSTGSELGRQLRFSGDSVGPLEGANDHRHQHPEGTSAPRQRSWAAAPSSHTREVEEGSTSLSSTSTSGTTSGATTQRTDRESEALASGSTRPEAAPLTLDAPTGNDQATSEPLQVDEDTTQDDPPDDDSGRELTLSGYRVGAPRARGPDPYDRFESPDEPPSNLRHFPTRDRELGDDLRLSGLLGPSGSVAGESETGSDVASHDSTEAANRKRRESKHPSDTSDTSRTPRDSE